LTKKEEMKYLSSYISALILLGSSSLGFSLSSSADRRSFLTQASAAFVGTLAVSPAFAAPAPEIFKTSKGIKYAVIAPAVKNLGVIGGIPQKGDIVAIEYTGYLSNGQIFDATHALGKKNTLVFELGGSAVIDGINEMVLNMDGAGQKVQAIIPAELAFGDKGLCLENGECLIPPKSTLVYDIFLKRTAIPPP
jgi:FKBP-type peptidyl-prolyl cis-trans isomerase